MPLALPDMRCTTERSHYWFIKHQSANLQTIRSSSQTCPPNLPDLPYELVDATMPTEQGISLGPISIARVSAR
jgi:hypothetical protein